MDQTDFDPASYPDVPLFNIRAVAARTGVPSITLRSWERRYGIPAPSRDSKGYRLYSERDVARINWLKDRLRDRVGIGPAANMLRAVENGVLTAGAGSTSEFVAPRLRLLEALQNLDEVEASRIIGEALSSASVEDISLHLIQPVLYDIGELWSSGALSVTTEHIGSHLMRSHLERLFHLSPAPFRRGRILVGCAPGEAHDIGALMLALFLRRRGFDVSYMGANVEAESLILDVIRLQPSAVCLSTTSEDAMRAASAVYERLTGSTRAVLAFGGQAFNRNPELAPSRPGIYLGNDAASGVDGLRAAIRDR